MNHLAIFSDKGTIEKIFCCQKTVEIRLSEREIAPYKKVMKDDVVYLKLTGGNILGKVLVDNVLYFNNLNLEKISKIQKEYQKEIAKPKEFWYNKRAGKFGTLIFLKNPSRFLTPVKFSKHDRRGWVVLKNDL